MSLRRQLALDVARAHKSAGAGVIAVYHYESSRGEEEGEPVKLLEVSNETVPAGVLPIYLRPRTDIDLAVVLIELTAEEFQALELGELELPNGWDHRVELLPLVA